MARGRQKEKTEKRKIKTEERKRGKNKDAENKRKGLEERQYSTKKDIKCIDKLYKYDIIFIENIERKYKK